AFAHVVAGEVVVLFAQDLVIPRIAVEQAGQRGAEALFVGAALMGVDGVRIGVHGLGVGGSPLHGDFQADAAGGVLGLEGDDLVVDQLDLLGGVQVLDVVQQAVLVQVVDAARL